LEGTDLADSEIQKTPGWLTPYIFSGLAYANMCNHDKAIELLPRGPNIGIVGGQRYASKYEESANCLRRLHAGEMPEGCRQ